MHNCSICGNKMKLFPSISERIRKHGGTRKYYQNIFSSHNQCIVDKRNKESIELIQKMKGKE